MIGEWEVFKGRDPFAAVGSSLPVKTGLSGVGRWGPRYLANKRECGPVRVPSSLTEVSSFWNHERTWLCLTPYKPAGWCCPWGFGRVNQCCVVDRPQRHPSLGDLGSWRVCILPYEWVAPLDGQASWVNP